MADIELADVFDSIGAGISLNTSTTRFPARLADGSLRDYNIAQMRGVVSGGDVPSATNTDLSTFGANEVTVTGTTPITGFTVTEGEVVFVTFDDSLLLTYDGTNLPIQGGADVTTKAGDKAIIVGGASDIGYIKQYIPYVPPNTLGLGTAQAKATDTEVQIGDIDAAGNETVIIINDVAHTVQIKSNNLFAALGASILLGGITEQIALFCKSGIIDTQDGAGALGDNGSAGNDTTIRWDDVAKTITLSAQNGVIINGQPTEVMLASEEVATDVGTKQALYTVPSAKRCVITKVIVKDASTSLAAMGDVLLFGFDAGASNYGALGYAAFTPVVDDTFVLNFTQGAFVPAATTIGIAADVFGCIFNDTSITGGTVHIDVFGYLYDA